MPPPVPPMGRYTGPRGDNGPLIDGVPAWRRNRGPPAAAAIPLLTSPARPRQPIRAPSQPRHSDRCGRGAPARCPGSASSLFSLPADTTSFICRLQTRRAENVHSEPHGMSGRVPDTYVIVRQCRGKFRRPQACRPVQIRAWPLPPSRRISGASGSVERRRRRTSIMHGLSDRFA